MCMDFLDHDAMLVDEWKFSVQDLEYLDHVEALLVQNADMLPITPLVTVPSNVPMNLGVPSSVSTNPSVSRGRGRPKGSRNKSSSDKPTEPKEKQPVGWPRGSGPNQLKKAELAAEYRARKQELALKKKHQNMSAVAGPMETDSHPEPSGSNVITAAPQLASIFLPPQTTLNLEKQKPQTSGFISGPIFTAQNPLQNSGSPMQPAAFLQTNLNPEKQKHQTSALIPSPNFTAPDPLQNSPPMEPAFKAPGPLQTSSSPMEPAAFLQTNLNSEKASPNFTAVPPLQNSRSSMEEQLAPDDDEDDPFVNGDGLGTENEGLPDDDEYDDTGKKCTNPTSGKTTVTFNSWDSRILAKLPPAMAAEFPARLSHHSTISHTTFGYMLFPKWNGPKTIL
ncbi:hypothetical protein C8R44DRAFT_745247 [Mycena epipterygia]|nr:hypothetical protein C8R44DRAFT_745247 [Mycena epipterygia]